MHTQAQTAPHFLSLILLQLETLPVLYIIILYNSGIELTLSSGSLEVLEVLEVH